jgi:RHS repeat-associated protein
LGADGTAYAAASFSSYLRARSYDPTLGRFLSRDSWPGSSSAPQTLDRYTYVADNPTTRSDPSGHCFVDTIADVGFLAWDVISLASGPPKERETNLTAFGADLIGAALPCATGLGMAVRGSIRWVRTASRAAPDLAGLSSKITARWRSVVGRRRRSAMPSNADSSSWRLTFGPAVRPRGTFTQ